MLDMEFRGVAEWPNGHVYERQCCSIRDHV